VPALQGLGPVSERHQSTRVPPKRPRRLSGNLRAGSRSPAPNKKFLLQLLHLEFRKGSRSSNQKGILILSTLFYRLLLIRELPCRVPQDIPLASPAKNISPESESPKVDKPLSPSAGKTFSVMSKAPSPEDTNVSTGAVSNPISPSTVDSRHDAAHQSLRPDPTEHLEASP
jgi:hypothetical protein